MLSTLLCSISYADFGFWASSSVIWGQGNFGGYYRLPNKSSISYSQFFVFEWKDLNIDYHEENIKYSWSNYATGIIFRNDKEYHETSPFFQFYFKNTSSILEYRTKNTLGIEDYFRYNFNISYDFAEYDDYKFFITSSSFLNLNDQSLEKQLFYLGLRREYENATISLYIIPYKYGDLGQSWDDTSFFGGSFVYKF